MTAWRYQMGIHDLLGEADSGPAFEKNRDEIVAKIKESVDYALDTNDPPFRRTELQEIVDEMEDCNESDWFNAVLDVLYDWGDRYLVWIG